MNTPPPVPFGEQTSVAQDNKRAIGKGIAFGCGGCALLIVAVAILGCGIFGIVMASLRNSDACQLAVAKARESKAVQAALGEPIEMGWLLSGNVNMVNDSGNANLSIPLAGPKGEGNLNAVGTKQNGTWSYTRLAFYAKGADAPIDLLPNK